MSPRAENRTSLDAILSDAYKTSPLSMIIAPKDGMIDFSLETHLPPRYSFKEDRKAIFGEAKDKPYRKGQDPFMEDNTLEAPRRSPPRLEGWNNKIF